jgi:hypothetical protein
MMDVQATGEASALQREHPALQKMKFINLFSSFLVHFCPPGSGYRSRDPLISNPIRIRIRILNAGSQIKNLRDLIFKCVKDSSKVIITVFVNLLFRMLLLLFKLRIADPDPDFADRIHNFFTSMRIRA